MARSFHRKQRLEANSELNVTALIDLGFALLIIFMIATPLIEKEQIMEVDLPVASDSVADIPPDTVDIIVLPGGYRVDGNLIGEAALNEELAQYAAMSKTPVLSIRADADTSYQNVVRLLDLLKQHKLSRINLVTRPED